MKLITFIETRPTASGWPQVVVCRLSNDDTPEIARTLESAIVERCEQHDTLKAKADLLDGTVKKLKAAEDVLRQIEVKTANEGVLFADSIAVINKLALDGMRAAKA